MLFPNGSKRGGGVAGADAERVSGPVAPAPGDGFYSQRYFERRRSAPSPKGR